MQVSETRIEEGKCFCRGFRSIVVVYVCLFVLESVGSVAVARGEVV